MSNPNQKSKCGCVCHNIASGFLGEVASHASCSHCNPPEPTDPKVADWEKESFTEQFAKNYYGKDGQGFVKLRDLTFDYMNQQILKAKREVIEKVKQSFPAGLNYTYGNIQSVLKLIEEELG